MNEYMEKIIEKTTNQITVLKESIGKLSSVFDSWEIYELKNKLKRKEVILEGLKYFATLDLDGYGSLTISNYFYINFDKLGRFNFGIKNEIESEVYDYVYNSHSELNRIAHDKLGSFLSPIMSNYKSLEDLFNFSNWEINDVDKSKNRLVYILKSIVEELTSDKVKPFLELAEKYVDMLIEKGKKEYDE